jgi:hypothetical protein
MTPVQPDGRHVEVDEVLAGVSAVFRDGAFRISLPAEAGAYFRDAVIGLQRPNGGRVIARRDLLQAARLDDIEIRPPLSMADSTTEGLSLRLQAPSGDHRTLLLPVCIDPAEIGADMVTCYLNCGGGGNPVIDAFASSMGARRAYAEDGVREGVAIVWGVQRGSKAVIDAVAERGGFFYHIDQAYFGRGHLLRYRVTRNGFEAGPVRRCPTDRIAALNIDLQPWKPPGRYVLVCPPTEKFMLWHGCHDWLEKTLAALGAHTDREIVVRQKPRPDEAVIPLEDHLAGAHAVVTHSSNVAVEAVVAGVPVFVAPSSAAAAVGRTDLGQIENPVRPDRLAWLAHLSYSQFEFEEVKQGGAWRWLREFETWPFIDGQEV